MSELTPIPIESSSSERPNSIVEALATPQTARNFFEAKLKELARSRGYANTGEMEKAYNIDVILSENFAEIAREGAPDNSQIYYDMVVVPDVLVEENEIKRRGVKQTTREDRLFWVRDENGSLVRAATNYPNLDRWQIDISDETVQTRFANRTGLGSETNITYSDESQKNTAEHFDMVFNNHISKKTMKQRVLNALRNLLIRK